MNIFNIVLIQPLANGLVFFYKTLGNNMGVAIVVFSFLLRFALNPLTKPYMESMKKMKDLAPELEKLKKKYAGDKQKFMQAQADFYKEKKVNPGAGCLPYILQIAVLIAMFNVFSTALTSKDGSLNAFNNLLYNPLKFSAGETLNTRFLYLDVTKPDIIKFSFIPFAIPGPILILATLAQVLSAKMMAPLVENEKKVAAKTPGEGDDFSAAMQQSSLITFPLLTLVFGMRFASGLALYWFLFSVLQIYQQYQTSGWGGATAWIRRLNLLESKIIK